MKSQRGQLAIYSALAAGAVFLIMGIALKVQSQRLESCKEEHQKFVAQVEANGKLAEQRKKEKEAQDAKDKEQNDAKLKTLTASNAVLSRQLRDARASSGILPKPATPADSTKPACFDRAKLESALQRLDAGVSGLLAEGDTLGIRLKLSQEWALSTLR